MAAPVEIGGTRQLVVLGHDRVFGVRAEDGQRRVDPPPGRARGADARGSARVGRDDSCLPRSANAILIEVTGQGEALKAAEVWRSPRLKSSLSPNVAQGGFVYGFNAQFLVCVDAATGEPRWRQKVYAGSLIRVGGHLLILGEQSGTLRVVEATPEAYRSVAEAAVLERGCAVEHRTKLRGRPRVRPQHRGDGGAGPPRRRRPPAPR